MMMMRNAMQRCAGAADRFDNDVMARPDGMMLYGMVVSATTAVHRRLAWGLNERRYRIHLSTGGYEGSGMV